MMMMMMMMMMMTTTTTTTAIHPHDRPLTRAPRYWMGKEQKLLRFDEKDKDLEAMHEALWTIGGVLLARFPHCICVTLKPRDTHAI